ncbi:MAG: Ldh family oxidoreductase [Chloroflexi bacterium]|nr:Ldh family oxidoreductase [Chloroflexota bacterium]
MLERFFVPEKDRVYVKQEKMRSATEAIFLKMGLSKGDAALSTDVLMLSDLCGVETHGVSNMMRAYVKGYNEGSINPRPKLRVLRETSITATLDHDRGLGLHMAPKSMEMAIEKAEQHGIGMVVAKNCRHLGMLAYHAMMPLKHDMVGVCMTGGGGFAMLPTFGAEPRFGTNPLAWAAPARKMPPFVFDIATTQVAGNKILLAKRLGAKMEPGWVSKADGTPIMEEVAVPDQYYMLPIGGTRENGSHKGYGFACIVDIMSNMLSGSGGGFLNPATGGQYFAAYKISAFTDLDEYYDNMDKWLAGLAATPPAAGHKRVVYAGLPESEEFERRMREGIPYHREVVEWYGSIGAELGLEFDLA